MSASLGSEVGRASRAGAVAVLEAHVLVQKGKPLRAAVSEMLKKHSKLGGNDRRFVAFGVRELSRHLRRLDLSARLRGRAPSSLQLLEDQAIVRYAIWRAEMTGATKQRVCAELALPGPIRPRSIPDAVVDEVLSKEVVLPLPLDPVERAATVHSFPTWLAQSLARVAPDGELDAIFGALNREPFLSFVVRPPAVREDVARALKAQGISVQISEKVPNAMTLVDEGRAIFETRWVKEGHLVVMDLGSQQLAQLCRVLAGQTVIDVCAGAGGKTIVLADAVGPNGRVYAHDTSAKRLSEAKRRVAELRLRHVSFPKEPRYDLADVVLVDAPCSGTGTLAREPDQKWKLTPQRVAELVKTQRSILDEVVTRVRPGTVLVYGTCSLLHEENEAVVEAFLQEHREVQLMEAPLRVWPHRLEGGGFFGARLLKT